MKKLEQNHYYNEFTLNIYEQDSNRFLVKVIWFAFFVQAVGYILSLFNKVMAHPEIFYVCGAFTLIIIISGYIVIKKYPESKRTKYFLVSLVLLVAGSLQYAYINDIAIQFIWIFPVMTTLLYYDKNLVLYALIIASIGVAVVDTITPPMYQPNNISDMIITSIFFLFVIFASFYLLFSHIKQLKDSTDNTANAVISGTMIINHAIKNEIVKIGMCIENIERESGGNSIIKDSLEVIDDSVGHLTQLVGSIQAKIQKIEPQMIEVNVSQILDDCLLSFGPRFQLKHIAIQKKFKTEIILNCDPVHFREVINNIIINSIEAIEHDHGIITVESYHKKNETCIVITDNGIGISKENLPRVVSPLFSTKPVRTLNYGLGLTYCYNVVKEHHGSLIIESEKNIGTTVILKFPITNKDNADG
jgi:signal transduction histidine kinase